VEAFAGEQRASSLGSADGALDDLAAARDDLAAALYDLAAALYDLAAALAIAGAEVERAHEARLEEAGEED